MYLVFEVFTVILELLFIHIFTTGLFHKYQRSRKSVFISYALFGALLCVLSLLPINPFVKLTFIFVSIGLLTRFLFVAKLLSSIYCALLICIINVVVDIVCSGIIAFFGLPINSLLEYGNNRIIYIVIAKITQLFFYHIVIKLSNWHRANESLIGAVPLLLCQVFSVFICHTMFLAVYNEQTSVTIDFVIGAVGILYINVIIFLYVERIKAVYEMKRQNELAEQQFKSELEYFQHLIDDREETRALWHDISKYMNTMQSLIDSNEINHARECVDQASKLFSNIGNVVDIGNTVVNAVLNQRVQKARRMNIPVELDVRIPEEVNVSSADLSIIIGNTFDNSLDACSALSEKKRRISIHIIQKGKMLLYEIENHFTEGEPVLSKSKRVQGYGLKNVKRCVDKYKGDMSIDKSEGIFKVSIHLNT